MEISRKGYNTMTEAFVANGCIPSSPRYHSYVVSSKVLEFLHQLRTYLPSLSEHAFLEPVYTVKGIPGSTLRSPGGFMNAYGTYLWILDTEKC